MGYWRMLLFRYNLRIFVQPNHGIIDLWWEPRKHLVGQTATLWDSVWAAGCWALWRERNRRLFTNANKTIPQLVDQTAIEIMKWRSSI
ncbi:hypothetical protein FCM35_KLT16879 [Carex littledalei]|uniref:Uncharacterized protein n=1 Tax=Carex littledalei TaxID=544730 RepID=A0A833RGK1_9POAL|nr:hypothetical protein FCM35_KLT16879 [Carex littledalei]